jgi:nicotinate phosphoribosyltransferase
LEGGQSCPQPAFSRPKEFLVNGLLTDLYELTMAAGYYDAGKVNQKATFELTIRRLPAHRNFVIAAGLPQAIYYMLNL